MFMEATMTEQELLLLWGKTCREKDDPQHYRLRYHPLFFHLLDVGHAELALWDKVLPKKIKERLATALGCSVEDARIVLAFLTALHDLGKAAPGFQLQPTGLEWLPRRLLALGLKSPAQPRNEPHNFISTKELRRFWHENTVAWKVELESGRVLSHITGAHHGTFPISQDYANWPEDVMGDASWEQVRFEMFIALKNALCPPDFVFPDCNAWNDLGAVPLLAGLISVADWIGSSSHFPTEGHRDHVMSVARYLPLSRQRAEGALAEFGWTSTPVPTSPRPDFQQFWKFVPNSLQQVIVRQTENLTEPFLCIAEAPMGVGKTEAALWATDAALAAQINAGFYVALPTQATSNAMHRRIKDFLGQRLADAKNLHLQLVHGNAALSEDVEVLWKGLADLFGPNSAETEKARVVALSWFCGAKRPLLAPFGVGTIDQSLMAALQTHHWFVRLFGLAGKVVIFDEVHAYDTYMSHLLVTLLGWLKELGCSVILLSATLPSGKRHELLEAWGAPKPTEEVPYPRVTWCGTGQAESLAVSPQELRPQTIAVSHLHPDHLAAALRQKLGQGGSAAIICNTVAEAQTLFKSLKQELGDFAEPDNWILFHAQMPFGWRQRIETKILKKFGKHKASRPQRAIVVSTQVLEQSLDIDFDWMASFSAPSDLWLQRLGRLHRHALDEHKTPITRPAGLETPEFVLLSDIGGEADAPPPSFGPTQWIYDREILLRSWLLWRGKVALQLPDEIETLIEDTYTNAPVIPDQDWQIALDSARSEREEDQRKSKVTAGNVVISTKTSGGTTRRPSRFVETTTHDLRDDDDPAVHVSMRASTREGQPSITVICLYEVDGRFYLPGEEGGANRDEELDLENEPDRDTIRKLMDFAIPISRPELRVPLSSKPVPKGWAKVPLLRHARVLAFGANGVVVGRKRLLLDDELGLVIEKV